MPDSLFEIAPRLDDLLPESLSDKVRATATRRSFHDGQVIQMRGDLNSGLCIVREGAVRAGNQGKDGSYLTTSIVSPGQCYGEFTVLAGLPRTHELIAIGDTVIDEIKKTHFLRLYQAEPELAQALLKINLVRNHSLLEFLDDMRRLPLHVHVAKFIYRMAAGTDEVTIRQEDLAFTFGVSRVSMGKVLKRLAGLDLLSLGYGRIRLGTPHHFEAWLAEHSLIAPLSHSVPTLPVPHAPHNRQSARRVRS